MSARQDSDNLAWDRSDEVFEEAEKYVSLPSACRKIESFAEKLFGKPATVIGARVIVGGFNALYLISLEGEDPRGGGDGPMYQQMTQLPIPEVCRHGTDPDIGPFIALEYIRSAQTNLSRVLEKPRDDPSDIPRSVPRHPGE